MQFIPAEFYGFSAGRHNPFCQAQSQFTGLQQISLFRSAAAPAQNRLDPGQQNGNAVWLGDVVVPAQAQRPHLVRTSIPAGNKNYWRRNNFPQCGAQRETIFTRKSDIQKDKVWVFLRCLSRYICKHLNYQSCIPLVFQEQRQLFPNGWVILNYHNFLHMAVTASSFSLY